LECAEAGETIKFIIGAAAMDLLPQTYFYLAILDKNTRIGLAIVLANRKRGLGSSQTLATHFGDMAA
jgi:hypothetical protein